MATIYYPSGCDDAVPAHSCDPCATKEKARVSDVAFIKTSFAFSDPTDPTEWASGIANGDIIVIPQILGSYDGGSEVLSPGYGRQSENLTGYNFTSTFKDPNYTANASFYNILKNSRNYKYAFKSSSQVHITNNTVSVIPKNPITESLTDDVVWEVLVKWADADLPEPQDEPAGIFNECFNLA